MKTSMQHLFLNIIALISMVGCVSDHAGEQKEIMVQLPDLQSVRLQKENDILFQANSGEFDEALIVAGKLCVLNQNDKTLPYLGIADLNDTDSFRWYVGQGYGEGQMLMPSLGIGDEQMILYDPTLKKVVLIDLSRICDPEYELTEKSTNIISQRVVPYKDLLLYLNPASYGGPEASLLASDMQWNAENEKWTSFYFNVMKGNIVFSLTENTFAVVFKYSPRIEFYDKNQKKQVVLSFPHPDSPLMKIQEGGMDSYLFEKSVLCFPCSFGAESCFVVDYYDEEKDNLLILDWSGRVLDAFRVQGKVKSCSISKDGQTVYVWQQIDDRDYLCSYSVCADQDS